jgi:hypothetical protein
MSLDQQYALGIELEATKIMLASVRQTNLRRAAARYCREAQSLRRQLCEGPLT